MANKHEAYELAQMQSLPLDAKIRMTQRRIKDWYEYWDGNVYISFSGGKDSQVLAHIVKNMYPEVPLVYVDTGLEYDSVREVGLSNADTVLHPKMSFKQIVTEYGYPIVSKEVAQAVWECQKRIRDGKEPPSYRIDKFNGTYTNKDGTKSAFNMTKWKFLLDAPFRISHYCCHTMKKYPSKSYEHQNNVKPYLGIMAVESRLRRQSWIREGCNAFETKRPTSQPMSFWTEQDVLLYIKRKNIQIANVYGDVVYTDSDGMLYDNPIFNDSMKLITTGAKRTGCVFCLFGISHETDKLLRLKEVEPQKFDYVMRGGKFDESGMWIPDKGLGYKFVIDWLNEHGNLKIKY